MNALPRAAVAHRILVVEDDADVRDVLAMVLHALVPGVTTERAENGLAAQRHLEGDAPFDLILCDIMMPGLDGARLLRDLHTKGALEGRKVLLVTAVPRDQIGDLLEIPGVVGYLQKPVDPTVLAARVREVLGIG